MSTLSAAMVALVLFVSNGLAATVTYNVRSEWEAALGGSFVAATFDSAPLPNGVNVNTTGDHAGLGFVDSSMGVWRDDISGAATTVWTFDFQLRGWGVDLDMPSGGSGVVFDFHEGTQGFHAAAIGSGFHGFQGIITTDQTFDNILTYTGSGQAYTFNTMVFAAPASASTPEPTSFFLVGIGVLGILTVGHIQTTLKA